MFEQTFKNFADQIKTVEVLIDQNPVFREICSDYEEIHSWLANHCLTKGHACEECHDAWEIRNELEREIQNILKDSDVQTRRNAP